MSRYSIPQDQIDQMEFDPLTDLMAKVQQEVCTLASLEYKLWTRRRELELLKHPELAQERTEERTEQTTIKNNKLSSSQLLKILKIAKERGVSLEDMINNHSFNEQ